jgi:hypothetical protein
MLTLFIPSLFFVHRRRVAAVLPAAASLLGGLLCFGFVSTVIGLREMNHYGSHSQFWASVAIGFMGTGFVVGGVRRLRR